MSECCTALTPKRSSLISAGIFQPSRNRANAGSSSESHGAISSLLPNGYFAFPSRSMVNLSRVDMSRSGRTESDCESTFERMTTRPGQGSPSTAEPNFASHRTRPFAARTLSASVNLSLSRCDLDPSLSSITWTGFFTVSELKRLPSRYILSA